MIARRYVLAAAALVLLVSGHRAVAATGSTPAAPAFSATAMASASVRILGPADADVASGAVTLSRTSALEFAGAREGIHVSSASMVAVGGAHNAAYAVTLAPEVKVTSGRRELSVTTVPASSGVTERLSPSGAGSVNVRAQVRMTAAEASGSYAGFLPITVAFN
ncbi:MAG TPA: DUF4402 domain-containing protein [Thermoanaerobaculia bacterium]|jgi:hypothetical protein